MSLIGLRQVDMRAPRFGSSWRPLAVDRGSLLRADQNRRSLPPHIERGKLSSPPNHDLVPCLAIIAAIALPQSLLNS